ncbi:hypothetical protein ZTR_09535 [Talaromyces verruculosus]|nr:hypothetical protein ZTR_09535 [Talaromyces verruculosus]
MATPDFDPYICASLHNKIVSFLTAQAPAHNNRIVHNFFDAYGDEANAIRDRLSGPLITFLENIDIMISNDPGSSPVMNFAPHLYIPNPNVFWALNGGLSDLFGEEHENWVVLYLATEQELGIYVDLDTHLCTWQQEVMPWMRTWYPLQTALQLWLNLYESGKFQPSVGLEAISDTAYHRRYIAADLTRDLEAYHNLLVAIQDRSPGSTASISDEPGLVDEETLDRFRISGFLRDFLLNAHRPSFMYIAPGLQIPSATWLQETLDADRGSERYNFVRRDGKVLRDDEPWEPDWMQRRSSSNWVGEPLPLFPGPKIESVSAAFEREDVKFLVNKISGLYSWPDLISQDAVRLILPNPIGDNGWVRDGNPDAITDADTDDVPESLVNNDSLYQYGWCPFLPSHGPHLSTILDNWRQLVESGEWLVGSDGVEGGIEVFRDADTEEHAISYRLTACFDG